MDIIKMTCINIVLQLTNGARFVGKECGLKVAIERRQPCSASECICLEDMTGPDS